MEVAAARTQPAGKEGKRGRAEACLRQAGALLQATVVARRV